MNINILIFAVVKFGLQLQDSWNLEARASERVPEKLIYQHLSKYVTFIFSPLKIKQWNRKGSR